MQALLLFLLQGTVPALPSEAQQLSGSLAAGIVRLLVASHLERSAYRVSEWSRERRSPPSGNGGCQMVEVQAPYLSSLAISLRQWCAVPRFSSFELP